MVLLGRRLTKIKLSRLTIMVGESFRADAAFAAPASGAGYD